MGAFLGTSSNHNSPRERIRWLSAEINDSRATIGEIKQARSTYETWMIGSIVLCVLSLYYGVEDWTGILILLSIVFGLLYWFSDSLRISKIIQLQKLKTRRTREYDRLAVAGRN